jgi:F-type H+-transporting ATPase subunit 8
MPQLIPFYFLNQIVAAFVVLFGIVYIFSKYILPSFTFQQVIRQYITKLSNKN